MAEAAAAPDWKARASQARIPTEAVIDGKSAAAASGKTFDCVSPIDGKVLGKIAAGDAEDVDRAVKSARAAFEASSQKVSLTNLSGRRDMSLLLALSACQVRLRSMHQGA